ncbi:MAG: LysR family transcriptional regulator [Bacillota bacterium]
MPYRLCSKIWLEDQGKVFGDGPCDLLQRIDRLGSLSKAAAEMQMSYHQAWNLINMLENNLGFALIERRIGGSQGGGSYLTKKGKTLMLRYLEFRNKVNENLQRLYDQYFAEMPL